MGGLFGGGGGSTQTVVQNNTPFNANQLMTVQNAAIDLLNNNPLSYYPGPTYANPTDLQTQSLNGSGGNAYNAGQAVAPWAGPSQLNAILANNGIVSGDYIRSAQNNYINPLASLGYNNPSAGAINTLGSYGMNNPYFQELANPTGTPAGAQLSYIASGGQIPYNIASALENPMGFAGAPQLSTVANGGYLSGVSPQMYQLASAGTNGPGATALSYYGNGGASSAVSPYASDLTGLGFGASSLISPQIAGLMGYGYGAGGAVSPYTSGLSGVASGGPAAGQLAATAEGQYLGSNPYLKAAFESAANPVIDAYQTAVSPKIDSSMEANGRFNSGANVNAQSIAQRNLGNTLADLSAGIFEPAYQQERQNMVNAATGLGSLQTNALTAAGQLKNAATGLGISGLSQGGQLQNTATNLGLTGLNNAGQLVSNAVGQGINAANAASNQYNSGLTNFLGAYNQGVNTLSGAANNLFTNNLGAYGTAGNLINTGAQTQAGAASNLVNNQTTGLSNAINAAVDAATKAGTLGYLGQNSQISALEGANNAYNTGVGQMLSATGQTPLLSQMGTQDYQTALAAGNNQQQLTQQQINDLIARFNANQFLPYQQLGQVAGIVGSGVPGTNALTSPLGGSPFNSLVSGLSGANSLFGGSGVFGSNGLFGSNGALGGLGGLGGIGAGTGIAGFDASLPSFASAGIPSAAEIASATADPLFTAAPFTDFLGSALLL